MNKAQLVNGIIKKTSGSIYRRDIEMVLEAFTEVVAEALNEGDKVQLIGFGTFEAVNKAERAGRNPLTGQEVIIPARVSPKFTAGANLKKIVNGEALSPKKNLE